MGWNPAYIGSGLRGRGKRFTTIEALPKIALGHAVAYTLNIWEKLRRCFDYAEVELSNNLTENSMRPVALGHKNWLRVGSAQAGPKVAAISSVVESIKKYLAAILPGWAIGRGRKSLG
jgi:transposase